MSSSDPSVVDAGSVDDPVAAARRWLERRGPTPATEREAEPGPPTTGAPDTDQEDLARRLVLGKLAAQARTRSELARALQAKQVPEEAATAVLDRMSEVGLVDDAGFARDWVSSRQQRRHLSRAALRRELLVKGVETEEIELALQPIDDDQEYAAALSLATRRHDSMRQLARDVRYRRLSAALGRRGFGGSLVARALREVLDDSEDSVPVRTDGFAGSAGA